MNVGRNANDIADKKQFVVFGFPRSGTTLLSRLLASHPEISCPPETNILNACGRFLREEKNAEGPSIGVLPAIEFLDIEPEFILDQLRQLFFSVHSMIATGKTVQVEKSGFDIFYINELEVLLSGHCKFISITRNPFDVAISVRDFVDTIAVLPPELHEYVRSIPNELEAFAQAWVDCNERLLEFEKNNNADFHRLKYEDLVSNPESTMENLVRFMGLEPHVDGLQNALIEDYPVGLGDWRIYESRQIKQDGIERWKGKIGATTANRILERVAFTLENLGYERPKLPKTPDPSKSVRQYKMAKEMLRSVAREKTDVN